MNCDEAPLVFAWTPLDNGVREACIGYLMTACCVYRLMLGICVCSFVRVPEDIWPLHSYLVYMSASSADHLFQRTWGLQKGDMKTVLLTAVSGCRRVQFIYHSEYMSSGDSIHCSAVFVWGSGKHII